jgi:hypothetical protein
VQLVLRTHKSFSRHNENRLIPTAAHSSVCGLFLAAAKSQGDPIVPHGPFIGDSKEDIARLFAEYQAGRVPRLSALREQHLANGLLTIYCMERARC